MCVFISIYLKELNKNVNICVNVSNATNPSSIHASNMTAINKEKAKLWVKNRAQHFLKTYDKSVKDEEMSNENELSESILVRLTKAISKLQNEVNIKNL